MQSGGMAGARLPARLWTRARLVAAVLVGVAALAACSPQTSARPSPPPSPAIWRLSDADSEIWLFGTVHMLPADLQWRSQAVNDAFAQAEVVVFETPTDEAAQAEVGRVVALTGRTPPGTTLAARLGSEDAARLNRVVRKLAIAPGALDDARPWLAALQLSLRWAATKGHVAENGVERVLDAEARDRAIEIRYFETPESQIRLLAELPPADELRFLTATLRQIDEDSDTVEELDAAWLRGDVARLGKLLTQDISEAGPEVYARLLTRRNANWTTEIDAMMRGRGRIFVAVGAAHLVGPDGVPAMLRARGYTVEGP